MLEESMRNRLRAGIVNGDDAQVVSAVKEALGAGMEPLDIIEAGLQPAMLEVGEMFRRYEVYLPEMMMAADAWEQAMKVLDPRLAAAGQTAKKPGRAVIGTVKGDIHSLGKNIVITMLKSSGFEVYDLGVDVPASAFVDKAEEVGARIIGVSALLTTTMPQQKSVIEHLEARGVRQKYFVMVGGGSTTQRWADEIGADGYGVTAGDAVSLALKAMKKEGA